jgi:hypothetical protein
MPPFSRRPKNDRFEKNPQSRPHGELRIMSGAGAGVQSLLIGLDTGFRRKDEKRDFSTAYELIKIEATHHDASFALAGLELIYAIIVMFPLAFFIKHIRREVLDVNQKMSCIEDLLVQFAGEQPQPAPNDASKSSHVFLKNADIHKRLSVSKVL